MKSQKMKVGGVLFMMLLYGVLVTSKAAVAETSVVRSWDAVVTVGMADVPFRFDIAVDGPEARGFFFEGGKRIASTSGRYADGELELNYDFLSSTLTAKFDGQALVGTYRYKRNNGKEYAFRATRAAQVAIGGEKGPDVSGDWEMKLVGEDRSEKKDPRIALTWQLYLRDAANGVSGSILRVDGSTGNLTGGCYGDTLTLSHFAGERPVLLQAKLSGDGTLDILYNSENRYLAVRKTDAGTRESLRPWIQTRTRALKLRRSRFISAFRT